MTLSDTDLEARLRHDLRARADAAPRAPHDLAELTRQRHRTLRRRDYGLVAAAVATVLVLVVVPVLASAFAADADRGQTARPSPAAPVSTTQSLADIPTRGSLGGDEAWLRGMLAREWTQAGEIDPPSDTRSVSFAQDVPGGRVALVLGQWDGMGVHAWFSGPEGAAPDQMELASAPSETVVGEPQALMDVPDPASDTIRVVVVAFPGDTAEVLVRRDVDGDGEEVETWLDLGLEDGASVGELAGVPVDQLMGGGIWVHRDAERSQQVFPQPTDDTFARRYSNVDVADPRGLSGTVSDDLVQEGALCLRSYFGGPPEDLGLTLLAAGPIGGSSMNQVALVGATFPSGAKTACLVAQQTSVDPGSVQTTSVRLDAVPPSDVLLVNEVFAVPAVDSIAVSGPAAATRAEIYLADGTLLTSVPLVAGAGVGPLPPPTAMYVRFLSASGALIVEAPITAWAE